MEVMAAKGLPLSADMVPMSATMPASPVESEALILSTSGSMMLVSLDGFMSCVVLSSGANIRQIGQVYVGCGVFSKNKGVVLFGISLSNV
jgi:hypothetical protein